MFQLRRTWTAMELLPLVCFCLLICSGTTFGDEVIQMTVNEGENVTLPCSYGSTNIRSDVFDWKKDDQSVFQFSASSHYNNDRGGQDQQFKGRVFHFEDQLQSGNASIVIRNTKKTDSGFYRCVFPFKEPKIRSRIQLIVETPITKMRVKEGEDVILPCSYDSTDIRTETFDWKKDDQNVFQYVQSSHSNNGRGGQDPQFKGRVFHFEDQLQSGNASIVIRKTKKTDSGIYSCTFPFHQSTIRSIIELLVGSCPKPSVTILRETKDWALLQCEVQIQDGFPKPKVEWLDSGNKTVPVTNTSEGKYNIILKATVTKSDVYRCVSTQEGICHQIDQKINVYLSGAASKPIISIHKETNEGVLLQCEVQGVSPKPKVVWKDSAGNIVPAKEPEVTENEGSYNIILKATVTKTDNYRCVSTQEEIKHEVHAETYVHLNDSSTGLIVGFVVVLILLILVTGACLYFKRQSNSATAYHLINRCLQCRCQQNDKDPAELEAGQQNGAQESMMPTADARAEHEAERLNLKRPEQPDQKVINKAELMSL